MDCHLIFRQKRQSLGISLQQASEQTKIRATYLKAIEEGDFANLPDAFFAKSYIREYAFFLTISPEPLLIEYDRYLNRLQNGTQSDKLSQVALPEKPTDAEIADLVAYETDFKKKKILHIVLGLFLFAIVALTAIVAISYYPNVFFTQETENSVPMRQTTAPTEPLIATISVNSATLRIDPHIDAEPVTWASKGVRLIVKDIYTEQDTGKKWYKVTTSDGKDCWVADKVVTLSQN